MNKGVELSLSTANVRSKAPSGFTWITTLNLAFNRNWITKLFGDEPFFLHGPPAHQPGRGRPADRRVPGDWFEGVDPATICDAIYDDINGDGDIMMWIAPSSAVHGPDPTGGLNSTI